MKKPIRSKMTVKASSIHDSTNIYDCAGTHERTTTPPRIFRPLFQTKDSPSLGRRSSELMSRFISRFASRTMSGFVDRSIGKSMSGFLLNNTKTSSLVSLLVIFCLSFLFMFGYPNDVYADYSISMTSSGAQNIDVSAGGNGTAISADNITVTTNCKAGYNFSMATSVSNNNLYLNGSISNNASGTYFSPVDGTSALSSTNNKNKWGYYYNSSTPTTAPNASSVFSAVPVISSPATVISPTSSATDINDSFNIYYGVAASSGLAPGTYKMIPDTNNSNNDGTIIYYLTLAEACMPYLVQFNPTSTAGGTTLSGTGTMAAQTIPAGTPTNLNANTFTAPSGYEFDGWNTAQDGTGTSYTDGQSVTDLTTGGGNITLYAQWEVPPIAMQNLRLSDCRVNVGVGGNATDIGDSITVVDKRDDKEYTVRYINGECWMTQNLRYLGDTGSAAKTMTIGNNNSNVANTSIELYSLNSSNAGNFNAYSSHCDSTNGNNYACVYDSGDTTTGVWYNYFAASAGTISGSSNNTAATSDICPAGWHLPSGPNTTANTDYNKLVGNTTSGWQAATSGLTAFSGVAGGRYYIGSLGITGHGLWWSATAYDTANRSNLGYYSSDGQFHGNFYFYRYSGNFVRCVKDSDGYMQDFALADAGDDVEYTLMDKRDNNTYTVKKINGELWMTQNLRYLGDTGSAAGTMTIGNNNSNVANKSITLYSLDSSNSGSFNAHSSSTCGTGNTAGYNHACVYDSGSTSTGVWYNYFAASAGTISGSSNSTAATSDICPAGWHLPSGPNTTADTDYNKLVGNTGSGYQSATSGLTAFSAVAGGSYNATSGSVRNTERGIWWSASASSFNMRYILAYYSNNGQFRGDYTSLRYGGNFVRCVRSS